MVSINQGHNIDAQRGKGLSVTQYADTSTDHVEVSK
jgi:hypothetical protein